MALIVGALFFLAAAIHAWVGNTAAAGFTATAALVWIVFGAKDPP